MRRSARMFTVAAVSAGLMRVVLPPASAAVFSNPAPITNPSPGPGQHGAPATPYPSNITVSGLTGTVTDVNVTLNDFDCSERGTDFAYPEDIDILLVGPTGVAVVVLSDIGGANQENPLQFTNIDVTLDDQATNALPADTQLSAGTYRPVDDDDDPDERIANNADPFAAPAPAPTGTGLSAFNGTNPNGTWSLYVVDDFAGPNNCHINGGWSIDILTGSTPTSTSTSTSTPTSTSTSTSTPTSTSTSTSTPTSTSTSTTLPPCTITGAGDIVGTEGNDVICGSAGSDRIAGLGGNDVILGRGGNDQLSGGAGNDTLRGGEGSDQLSGGDGNDQLYGDGGGVDRLSGGAGDDYLNTVDSSGDDYLGGGPHVTGDTCVGDGGDSKALCER